MKTIFTGYKHYYHFKVPYKADTKVTPLHLMVNYYFLVKK